MAVEIFEHEPSGSIILPILEPLLPYPLPVYQRLQFHHRSVSGHVLASFPPATSTKLPNEPPRCFAVAFVDRSRRPETECQIFLSGEVPGRCNLSSSSKECQDCSRALLSLIQHIAGLKVPDSVHDLEALHRQSESNKLLGHVLNQDIILIGGINASSAQIIRKARLLAENQPGAESAYIKYLFPPSSVPVSSGQLPEGLRWGHVRRRDFALVKSRTQIPRQDATLAMVPSLALFPMETESSPIAWAFLGPDGSLMTLHVEESWRGKGLAKMLVKKLFREGGVLSEDIARNSSSRNAKVRPRWFHSDTALDNHSSQGVSKALGGKEGWTVYWIRVDLAKARSMGIN